MIVADTHAWLWWIASDAALSPAARRALDSAFADAALGVSAISVWEAAMLVKNGRLELALPLEDLVARTPGHAGHEGRAVARCRRAQHRLVTGRTGPPDAGRPGATNVPANRIETARVSPMPAHTAGTVSATPAPGR